MNTEDVAINPILNDLSIRSGELDLSKYKKNIEHFYKPNIFLYWLDFLSSSLIGNAFLYLAVLSHSFSLAQIFCIIVSSLFLFRAAIFVHEESHQGRKLWGFKWLYNLVFGFLHKLPSYYYAPHRNHHAVNSYGTVNDPDYDRILENPAPAILIPFVAMVFIPPLVLLRFTLVPLLLPFIGKKGRLFIYKYISSLVMNFEFKRDEPKRESEYIDWYVQDFFCFIYSLLFLGAMVFNILPWKLLWVWFSVMYLIYVINYCKALSSHTYLSGFNKTTFKEQVLDSGTLPPLYLIWMFPVGERYHALHHMFPNIPYHNLGKAHKRLLDELPDDHPYRFTISNSYFASLKRLLLPYKTNDPLIGEKSELQES